MRYKFWFHFRWSTSISLIFVKQITLNSELSNFDNDSILQASHCHSLSISVLWTMIIHARFLIKTCHHASHSYALSKHNYLCICLEIFLSKCKPLARVDPIIYRPLTNWCESPCKKKPFNVGITKIKMSRRVTWAKCWILFFFLSVCIFRCSNEQFLALIKQKSISSVLYHLCLSLTSHPSVCSYRVCHFAHLYNSVLNDTDPLIGCFKSLQNQEASLLFLRNSIFHRNPLLASRCWIPLVFFHPTSWCRVTCLIYSPMVSEHSAFQQTQTLPCLFFIPFCWDQ